MGNDDDTGQYKIVVKDELIEQAQNEQAFRKELKGLLNEAGIHEKICLLLNKHCVGAKFPVLIATGRHISITLIDSF